MWEGSQIHKVVGVHFKSETEIDETSNTDVEVVGGWTGITKNGKADMVQYMTTITDVYELKPISYYKNKSLNKNGKEQLKRYIQAMKKNGTPIRPQLGVSWNPNGVKIKYTENKTIELFTDYKNDPGMIYYTIIKHEKRDSVKKALENSFKENSKNNNTPFFAPLPTPGFIPI